MEDGNEGVVPEFHSEPFSFYSKASIAYAKDELQRLAIEKEECQSAYNEKLDHLENLETDIEEKTNELTSRFEDAKARWAFLRVDNIGALALG